MGNDQTDIEKKTKTTLEDNTQQYNHNCINTKTTAVYCGNTKGVSDNTALVTHMRMHAEIFYMME